MWGQLGTHKWVPNTWHFHFRVREKGFWSINFPSCFWRTWGNSVVTKTREPPGVALCTWLGQWALWVQWKWPPWSAAFSAVFFHTHSIFSQAKGADDLKNVHFPRCSGSLQKAIIVLLLFISIAKLIGNEYALICSIRKTKMKTQQIFEKLYCSIGGID